MKWYHISDSWSEKEILIQPRTCARQDDIDDDMTPCICVTPTIGQCVVAIGHWMDYSEFRIYEATGNPTPTDWVFDYYLTEEHRFYEPTLFKHIGTLDQKTIMKLELPYTIQWKNNEKTINKFNKISNKIIEKINMQYCLTN